MTDDKHRRQWMAMLAKMSCPMDAANATKALCDMLPMMTGLEEAYFSAQSLAFIAGRCKRVPTFGELKFHFGAWWQESLPANARNQSDYPRLEAPAPRRAPTEGEKAVAAELVRNLKAEMQSRASHRVIDEAERPKPMPLSDRQLLETHTILAAQGNRLSQARVDFLRQKLGIEEMTHAAQ